jgi:hypothetical protein
MNRPLLKKLVFFAVLFGFVALLARDVALDLTGPPEDRPSLLDLLNDIGEQEGSQAEQQEVQPEQEEVQSQEKSDDYMRILGDLRWHELTTHDEWRAKLPGCFNDISQNLYELGSAKSRGCAQPFVVGGIQFVPLQIRRQQNSGSRSGSISSEIGFGFRDAADYNAFEAIVKQKYPMTMKDSRERPLYCSSYTCWRFGAQFNNTRPVNAALYVNAAYAQPTQYTKSILSNEQLDSSQF